MKKFWLLLAAVAVCLYVGCDFKAVSQHGQSSALKLLRSNRIKRDAFDLVPIETQPDGSFRVEGIWIPQPDTAPNQLVFPEQVTIICDKGNPNCLEMRDEFVAVGDLISIKGPDETYWPIKSWDKNSLFAEYGPWLHSIEGPDKCQKHILSVLFASNTVTTSDIPDHAKGCEEFKETHTYSLASGDYYIDTSPNNNAFRARQP